MKQLFTKRMKTLAFFGTMGMLSFTLVAKPVLKTIKAYINPTISYTLDNKKVLEDTKTITYDSKTYVPLADVAKLMGIDVEYKNNTVMMTTHPKKISSPAVVIPKAIIKEVNVENKSVTIYKAGAEDKTESYIILKISDDTKIIGENDKKGYTLKDLKEGMEIGVKHSNIATFSLPPQTAAFEIEILAPKKADKEDPEDREDKEGEQEQKFLENVKIIEVNNSGKYIVIEDREAKEGSLKIIFDNKTKVKYEGSKKQPHANSLKAGQIVDIKFKQSIKEDDVVQVTISEMIVKN